ncbi:ribosylnicotinamide kinase [Mortierella sp. NVP85]|nr:ribosylnicotinamide kinase [Mortierella sp. NVP85]
MSTHGRATEGGSRTTRNIKVITIGLSGPSSGGKTTTSRYLRTILPNSTILHQDDFYLPEDQLPLDTNTGLANWDCPGAINFEQMISTLTYVKEHGQFPPEFNSLEDKNPVGSKPSIPIADEVLLPMKEKVMNLIPPEDRENTKFVILDGFILYVNEALRKTIDIKFFLTAPYQILKERRESRKGYATLEGYWEDPPGYFDNIVWPNYLIWNAPFVDITTAMEAGTETGVYNADEETTSRSDPMTQGVDIISSGDSSVQSMVQTATDLLVKRLSELSSSSS